MGEEYVGPDDLEVALAAADPSPSGFRLAISTPNGDWLAARSPNGKTIYRRLHKVSGHGGSVMGTGEWTETTTIGSWRPC